MGQLKMSRIVLTLLSLCLCSTTVLSSDYTCDYLAADGFYSQRITLNSGDKFSYKPQVGKSYPPAKDLLWMYPLPGQTCVAHYEMGTCTRLLFKCSSLNLRNRDQVPWRCGKGDKMIVFKHYDGEIFRDTRRYCRHRHPLRIRATEGITVKLVISGRTKGGQGGKYCSIRCLD